MTQPRSSRAQRRRQQEQVKRIEARYVRSNFCRVIHVDGAYGGPTGHGTIYMALYSEHNRVPESIQFTVDEKQGAIRESQLPRPLEWHREIEVEAILGLEFAKSLREWLDDKIKKAEDIRATGPGYQVIGLGTSSGEDQS